MQYKFVENTNFEDLSCGRVIYNKAGFPNYPVRLACEIFMRCLEVINEPDKKISLYDPCCGGGYLLTVLGFLYAERIASFYGSDVSPNAVCLAENNLSLLTFEGMLHRKEQLENMYRAYGKDSHRYAVESANNLLPEVRDTISRHVFKRDVLNPNDAADIKADVIITDVPYGGLVSWLGDEPFAINKMLDNLINNLNKNSVVAISSDKQQKINNPHFKRIEKFQIGKRKIEILKVLL